MKVKTIANKPKFEPIELVITIENPDELRELYHRMNIANVKVKEFSSDSFVSMHGDSNILELFDLLKNLCRKFNVK